MTDGIERRKITWQSEIVRLENLFNKHYEIDEQMHTETNSHMRTILEKLENIEGLMTAWNSIKGFAVVMHGLGSVMKWFIGIGAALASIWWALRGGVK